MYHAIVFLPLVGFLIAGLFGRVHRRARRARSSRPRFCSSPASLSWIAFVQVGFGAGATRTFRSANWLTSGELVVDWAFRIDTLTAVMLIVVTTVSALVHLYSIGYMDEDPHRPRFFAYLSLFTFAMLMLVTADNLVQMFFGWEGVGLASYLLIGFWYEKDRPPMPPPSRRSSSTASAISASRSASSWSSCCSAASPSSGIFPRVGELANAHFHFLGYRLARADARLPPPVHGRDGQVGAVPLHTWLPDAMEGPTPVSALIHAATMVTAGVFMVARLSPLFEAAPTALAVVTVIGAYHRVLRRHRRPRAERHQAGRSPIRPARSSATCSSGSASAPTRPASSTSSPTPSSRRCCSSAPARSSTRCTMSRTCATWGRFGAISRSRRP